MQNSIEWFDHAVNAAPEERATLAAWRLFLNHQNVCLHLDGSESVDQVTLPLYGIANGLAHDWWKLFGGRDREIGLITHRMGYAVPDIRMQFDGAALKIMAHQRTYQNPDVRFWAGPSETLDRSEAEKDLAALITAVLSQLHKKDVHGTSLEHRWSRIEASRRDSEEAIFCESAGALDLDPYAIDDGAATLIEKASNLFTGEALLEFLSGLRTGNDHAAESIEWVVRTESRPRHHSRLPALRDVAHRAALRSPLQQNKPIWALGYRRARAARMELDLAPDHRVRSYKAVTDKLGAPFFALALPVDGIMALRTDKDDGVHIHLRRQGNSRNAVSSHTFAFARALGDAICFPEPARSVVNELHEAFRQGAGRAFAAEFLAPVEEVVAWRAKGQDTARIADEYEVSTTLIERQIENVDRIRAACT